VPRGTLCSGYDAGYISGFEKPGQGEPCEDRLVSFPSPLQCDCHDPTGILTDCDHEAVCGQSN